MSIGRVENPPTGGVKAPAPEADVVAERQWLRAICDGSPVGIYRTDADGRCVYVNARWCELTGLPTEEAMGTGWLRAIHPEDRERVAGEWESAHRAGRAFESEYRYQRPDGSAVWIFGQVSIQRDAAGRMLGYIGSSTDVTEQRALRDALCHARVVLEATVAERTQKLFHMALAVEASGDAIVISDAEGGIVSWNKAAETMFGWTAAEMLGRSTERITPPELWQEAQRLKRRVRAGERVEGFETMRRRKDGATIEVSLSIFPLRDGRSRIVGTCAVVGDFTDLRKAGRRLQRLSRRLLEAQDEERRRLARELHDSAAQSVVALSMNLARLAQPGEFLAPEKRAEILATCLDLAAGATRELRTTVYLLHPPLLDERGLCAALEWFVGGFQTRSGIEVSLEIDVKVERLPYRYELALFRVAQECLSNVHRHSGSATATLRLHLAEGAVVLQVQDAGCGLPAGEQGEQGVGVSGMRERLAELGGTFAIAPSPRGTIVIARLPL
jgi:PAS domain S-box-containing protein